MKLSYEEWEVPNRLILGIDRALLAVAADAVHAPDQLFEGATQLGSLRIAMHEGVPSKVA